jgi:hypothetical protein
MKLLFLALSVLVRVFLRVVLLCGHVYMIVSICDTLFRPLWPPTMFMCFRINNTELVL